MIKATIAGKSVTGDALIVIAHQRKGIHVVAFGELLAADVVTSIEALLSSAKQAFVETPEVYAEIVKTVSERIQNGNQISN